MKKWLGAVGALVLAASSTTAATTYTGMFSSGEGAGSINLIGYPDGADFRFFFMTQAPIISGVVEYTYESGFDQYFDISGIDYGGDNEPNYQDHAITGSTYTTTLTTPNDYKLYYPDGDLAESDYFQPQNVSVDVFVADADDGDRFTFGVSPAPEPATWGLLVLGFGMIGGAVRARSAGRIAA